MRALTASRGGLIWSSQHRIDWPQAASAPACVPSSRVNTLMFDRRLERRDAVACSPRTVLAVNPRATMAGARLTATSGRPRLPNRPAPSSSVSVPSDFLTEVRLFNRPSRTLASDLIENLETEKVTCWHWRLAMKLGDVTDPDGKMPSTFA